MRRPTFSAGQLRAWLRMLTDELTPTLLGPPCRELLRAVGYSTWRNNVSPEHRGRYQEPANELNLKENPGKAGWAAGSVMRQRFLSTTITVMALAISAGVHPVLVRSAEQSDPATYLLPAADLPEGFEHQPQNDRTLVEPGAVRAIRFYTRGDPDVRRRSMRPSCSPRRSVTLATRQRRTFTRQSAPGPHWDTSFHR